jgi:hypothetical protein
LTWLARFARRASQRFGGFAQAACGLTQLARVLVLRLPLSGLAFAVTFTRTAGRIALRLAGLTLTALRATPLSLPGLTTLALSPLPVTLLSLSLFFSALLPLSPLALALLTLSLLTLSLLTLSLLTLSLLALAGLGRARLAGLVALAVSGLFARFPGHAGVVHRHRGRLHRHRRLAHGRLFGLRL